MGNTLHLENMEKKTPPLGNLHTLRCNDVFKRNETTVRNPWKLWLKACTLALLRWAPVRTTNRNRSESTEPKTWRVAEGFEKSRIYDDVWGFMTL